MIVLFFSVAKCNLGKLNLKAMLISSFSSYTRGGPVPLAGVPHDLYTQLLAYSSLQSVNSLLFACHSVLWFFPSLPPT